MSTFERKKVMPRYFAIAAILTLVGIAVVAKAGYIMTAKKSYWEKVASRLKRDSVIVKPARGNIFSADGQLMASSIPEYGVFMDFQPGKQRGVPIDTVARLKLDSLWHDSIDALCQSLHEIFPSRSAEEFKANLMEGKHKVNKDGSRGARHWRVWPRRVDYNTFMSLRSLPIFNLSAGKGGFHWEEYKARRRPFGSLAKRTLGEMKIASDSAYCGLELSYDSLLRGQNGLVHHQKIRNKYMNLTVAPPVDGADVITTIDVGMQDLAERALLEELRLPEVNGDMGVAILMEVKTGDIKAIVNMTKVGPGQYAEVQNNAISYRCEPGSVFKVASFLVALDDGVIDTSYVIHTGNGVMGMYNRQMKDHNWRRGGYGSINAARTLEVSSNIGVSYVIDKFYGSKPEKYVEGLYRVGIHEDLQLPISGYLPPIIRMPRKDKRGHYENWYKTALPWMSIGYETQIAPINTVAFYNAIANNGKMMRPRFVKKVVKDGVTIMETQPEVIKSQIAKPQAIATMQTVLRHVVSQGLGRKAGSRLFPVSGKTGTAQVADQYSNYHTGVTRYWLSFCGYFPSDNPQYTCIVCIKKTGLPASGGGMSGVVFHNIAEGVMAHRLKLDVSDARDSTSQLIPDVKSGNMIAADYVLSDLGVSVDGGWDGRYPDATPIWGNAQRNRADIKLTEKKMARNLMPDVTGMGARDAVYLLESMGVRVRVNGAGKVKSQSIPAGHALQTGTRCELHLN